MLFHVLSSLCSNIDPAQFGPSDPVSISHYSHCTANWWQFRRQIVILAAASVPQPPPRRPVAYAEHHESDEEKQFRRVFQQLAGDVSLIMSTQCSLQYSHYLFHFIDIRKRGNMSLSSVVLFLLFSSRTWRWAHLSWWTSSTESLQSVRHVCMCHI